jgi:hypothetical protein
MIIVIIGLCVANKNNICNATKIYNCLSQAGLTNSQHTFAFILTLSSVLGFIFTGAKMFILLKSKFFKLVALGLLNFMPLIY